MGKTSRAKQQVRLQRQGQLRDRPALIKILGEQLQLLQVLGDAFDAGHRVIGLQLATTVRALVHDTNQSHALLAQLGELNRMQFVDTSLPINPKNLPKAHNGLVLMKITADAGAEWVPRNETSPSPGAQPRNVTFSFWWNTAVTSDGSGTLWNRKQMIFDAANKQGWARTDPTQSIDIQALEEQNSVGWTYSDSITKDQPMLNGPLLPSARQIAYELELSIKRHVAELTARS